MNIDVSQLETIILIVWIIQIGIYSIQLLLPKLFNFGIRKTLVFSIVTCVILAIIIMVGDLYKGIPDSTCGSEKFNPIAIVGIYGSIGNTIIYLIVSIINTVANQKRKTHS